VTPFAIAVAIVGVLIAVVLYGGDE